MRTIEAWQDPNATLREIDTFLKDHRTGDVVDEWCQDLWDWIQKGGFEPDWARYELGASYYRCRKVSHDRGIRV